MKTLFTVMVLVTALTLSGCARQPDNDPTLPALVRTTAVSPEQAAIDNSEYIDSQAGGN